MAELDKFFNLMIEVGASDLHLASESWSALTTPYSTAIT
jgi:hypothetical protein